ncbi:hypothetical protein BCR42DRAFT_426879 [Absidia repens]|uniref:Uncharacterized protein n=1 Tax=Absidia repens TaxID=90262 RepID=A0A1X2I0P4_9FUNG|nr:hypothetical protein BCR42DRAFT_426879 [Absidia repens]
MNTFLLISTILLLFTTLAVGQSTDGSAPVSTGGFNPNDGQPQNQPEESWIKRDHHYVIIIVIVLLIVALVLYYIVRSIRGMRQRLARENEQQLQMINQSHQYQSPPHYQQNQPYSPIDERPVMMEGYKFDQHQQQQQQQQPNPHLHRY